jgi:hypothetical protein
VGAAVRRTACRALARAGSEPKGGLDFIESRHHRPRGSLLRVVEQYIKEGKNAIKWTRLSCRTFAANAVRLQLHVLAYNLGNFMRSGR